VHGIAQVQSERVMRSPQSRHTLPNAIGDGLADPLRITLASLFAPLEIGVGDQLHNMEGSSRMLQQYGEIMQPFRVAHVDEPTLVHDGPDIAFVTKESFRARRASRWRL
jgi:hypothetical protein